MRAKALDSTSVFPFIETLVLNSASRKMESITSLFSHHILPAYLKYVLNEKDLFSNTLHFETTSTRKDIA